MSFFGGIVKSLRKVAPVVSKTARSVSRTASGANSVMRAMGVPRSVTRVTQKVANVGSAASTATRASGAGKLPRPTRPLLGQGK